MTALKRGARRKTEKKKLNFSRKEVCVTPQTAICYGGYCKDGVIAPALGVKNGNYFDGYTPYNVAGGHYNAALKTYYILQTGAVMELKPTDEYFVYKCNLIVGDAFFVDEYVDGANRTVMISANAARALKQYTVENLDIGVRLKKGVYHHGRLFGIDEDDNFVLRWSGMDGVDNWETEVDGSGYARISNLYGHMLDLVSYGTRVLAVCERGIQLFTALGSPENYKIEDRALFVANIVEGTACVCGESVYFCADNGVYTYSDGEIKKLSDPFADTLVNVRRAAAMGDKYLVACDCKKTGESLIYCYDSGIGVGYFIDCAAKNFVVGEMTLAFKAENYGVIDGENGKIKWISEPMSFGTKLRKCVKSVAFTAKDEVEVTLSNGEYSRTITGKGGIYRFGMCGRSFTLTVNSECPVSDLKVYAEV